jgi:multiple sugar transport system ATP-binding protein
MIYVTHDQIEAMTLADRIVLMRVGTIEQEGAPLDLFERPATTFVAGFLGSPKMNFLPGRLRRQGNGTSIELGDGSTTLPLPGRPALESADDGAPLLLGLRPEHVTRAQAGSREGAPEGRSRDGTVLFDAVIELIQPTGARSYATFRLGGEPVMAELQAHDVSRPGERIALAINLDRAALFDAATERAI